MAKKHHYGFERYEVLADMDGGTDGLTPLEFRILMYLCQRVDWDECCLLKKPDAAAIAAHLHANTVYIRRVLKDLKGQGWLTPVESQKHHRTVLELTPLKERCDARRAAKQPAKKQPAQTRDATLEAAKQQLMDDDDAISSVKILRNDKDYRFLVFYKDGSRNYVN